MTTTKFKKLRDGAIIPYKEFETSAGLDLYVPEDIMVEEGKSVIKLGFSMQLAPCTCAEILARSGLELKGVKGYPHVNSTGEPQRYPKCNIKLGLVDQDYKGEVGVLVENNGEAFYLKKGDAIAQMLILPVIPVVVEEVEELDESERGEQGFNS